MITYEWRGHFDNAAINALHAEGFGHRGLDDDWWRQVNEHSLGWPALGNTVNSSGS